MVKIEVWLYGELAQYGDLNATKGFSRLEVVLEAGSKVGDLLGHIQMPTDARGITFINGNLSALPGLQPDLAQVLVDGDRVSFFDQRSMWPFQYRHGAAMAEGLNQILTDNPEAILHHQQKED